MVAGLAWVGLVTADEAQAQPGPFPQRCPGDSWEPAWGPSSDWKRCHNNPVCHCLDPTHRDIILVTMVGTADLVTQADLADPAEAHPAHPADPAEAHPADPAEAHPVVPADPVEAVSAAAA